MNSSFIESYFVWVFVPQVLIGILLGVLPPTAPAFKRFLQRHVVSRWLNAQMIVMGFGLFAFPLAAWAFPALRTWAPLVIIATLQVGVLSILRWVLTEHVVSSNAESDGQAD